jgi:hypothetical protein
VSRSEPRRARGLRPTPGLGACRWTPGPLVVPRLETGRDRANLPDARRPVGGRIASVGRPLRASSHETIEFEFHSLARPKLVSAPDRAGQAANQVEQATRQQEARWFGREQPVEFDPSFAEFSSLMTEVRYFDLRDPRLDSPG